jgi:hypothetical protein
MYDPLRLPSYMTPAQDEAWDVIASLSMKHLPWALLGGQLIWLLALESGTEPPRTTDDVDVLVDVRAQPDGIARLCRWLESVGFRVDGMSPDKVAHRFVRVANPGPGLVKVDVLAPDGLGPRAQLTTSRPGRTVQVPAGTQALADIERVPVLHGARVVRVPRPSLLAAIVSKAAASRIVARETDRDLEDAAFLLSLVEDPLRLTDAMTEKQARYLSALAPLASSEHAAWRGMEVGAAQRGRDSLAFLLE